MLNWIIFGIFIVLVLFYLRAEHVGRKFKLFTIIIFLLLFYLSAYKVLSSTGVDLTSPRGITRAVYIYVGWIGRSANNLWGIKTDVNKMVGNAVRMNNSEDKTHK